MFANILTDARFAFRQMRKAPGFTLVAVLTLAFGIGATSAIFSVVNGVLLRPLPYPEPSSLVRVFEVVPQYGRFSVAPANFLDWRTQATAFERIAAYSTGAATLVGADGPERINMASVSWDLFELLGVTPVLGRGFRQEEDVADANHVVVLSHGLWQRRFGSDLAVLGRSVAMSGTPVTVVGVMPAGFRFPNDEAEFWRPLGLPASPTRGGHFLGVIARVRDGVPVDQAGAEMQGVATRLAEAYPETNRDETAEVIPLHELIVGPIRPLLLTLVGAVAVVILIACANVAGLLLVRATVREQEIAIRTAMGAARGRLFTQMLTESLALALAGGVLGVLLAWAAIGPLQTLSAGSIPRVADITLDRTVLLFAAGVSMLAGLIFGLAPAWQGSRGDIGAVLKEGGRSAVAGGARLRSGLLIAEVALSLILLVGASLLLRSFASLTSVDPGFRPDNVLAFRVSLPSASFPEPHHRIAFYNRLLERLRTVPGVEAAGVSHMLPMRGSYVLSFEIDGRPPAATGQDPSASYRSVSADYFAAAGIPLKRGRVFEARDDERAPLVAVVDDAFAKRYFADVDPIGQRIDIGNGTDGFYEIVGVVGSIRHEGLDAAPQPTMYAPFPQDTFSGMAVLVRTAGDPAAYAGPARDVLREIDGTLPAFGMGPLAEVVTESVARRRFTMLLLTVFAAVALFLAAVGLYGLVAYSVSQRTQEIGVRMAIGADTGRVLRMVVGGGMKLALAGILVGVAGALALARYLESLLFAVTPFDPASYAVTAALLLAVAALACYIPARRAATVDPLVALRRQ